MFLLIDKPKGITSHDVIDGVRKVVDGRSPSSKSRRTKVGHAGTLDPNATGLLIVAIGRSSTKRLSEFVGLPKTYEAEIFLGATSDTEDAEGQITKSKFQDANKIQISKQQIAKVLKLFVGEQMQVPPIYSSIKIKGKPAHRRVRSGEEIELKPRKVTIYSIELLDFTYPILKIKTKVSSGTYIRSLARDIGSKLGVGGYLKNLRRTGVGKYKIKDAIGVDDLDKGDWEKYEVSL